MDLLRNIFKGDKVVWIIFLCLCLISVVEVFSASSTLIYTSGNHWAPITRHASFLLGGALVVLLFHNIPYRWFQLFPRVLLPLSAFFLILLLLFDNLHLGGFLVIEKTNEAGRWVKFFGLPFQPSEFAKMGVIIATAYILSRGQTEEGASPKAFRQILKVAGVMCLLILPENYSTGVLLFGVVYLMMIVGRIQTRKLLMLGGALATVILLFVGFLFITPNDTLEQIPLGHRFTTVKARIADFTSSEEVPPSKFDVDDNAQVGHARIAVATSSIIGKGPGNSVQRDFLSQAYSDFIFAIIIEELGLAGGGFVVFLYLWLLIRCWRIANRCERTFPAFLVLGIGLILTVQAMFNMMVAVGLAPVTGQPLPLISRGGTSTLINCVYIGIILSVSRYNIEQQEKRKAEEEAAAAHTELPNALATVTGPAEPTAASLNNDDEMA
ncbi:MAG TPA: FtsW/RodA/SpoVE family cell cycle protein [Candidatus Bacteroides avicola]|uniref:Probable peptidoglycan glycosyltransferase FtsW n=1 Tax=Candidatus Bacteroides avicola TaxID=2838468 RepID=A0A9D2HZ00_9BACE|nr:FtsW/RodA/SpoVE family cell cycle protein [Mediterranea sp. An20]MBW9201603.1 FtsW/RodA/SpoVE family cell cycle protein [Bacteroidales bacterium SW292]OUP11198.1 rod shape-determining protein RodA [Mediterranea sp. An20]HJA86452.1 FtsW/RodA/SpoVE family cell cycle protein [Candidatus Bacteroides avicola]